jgi:hypothetical protein
MLRGRGKRILVPALLVVLALAIALLARPTRAPADPLPGISTWGEALPTAPACHPNRRWSVSANLDGDAAKELVQAIDRHDCQHSHYWASVTVRDRCRSASRTFLLEDEQLPLQEVRVTDVDGWTRRREVFFIAGDKAKIVRLMDRWHGCPRPVDIFTVGGASSVLLADLTPRYRGLEVRVVANSETMLFRYSRRKRRYVTYVG